MLGWWRLLHVVVRVRLLIHRVHDSGGCCWLLWRRWRVLGKLLAFRANQGLQQFGSPVDLSFCPNYSSVVKTPMDLGTVRERVVSGFYGSAHDAFARDCQLVFDNARTYHPKHSSVHALALELSNEGYKLEELDTTTGAH